MRIRYLSVYATRLRAIVTIRSADRYVSDEKMYKTAWKLYIIFYYNYITNRRKKSFVPLYRHYWNNATSVTPGPFTDFPRGRPDHLTGGMCKVKYRVYTVEYIYMFFIFILYHYRTNVHRDLGNLFRFRTDPGSGLYKSVLSDFSSFFFFLHDCRHHFCLVKMSR